MYLASLETLNYFPGVVWLKSASMYFFSATQSSNTPAENELKLSDVMEFFFIAHPHSGRKEGEEHKRIMYFSPKFETLDRQTEVTGFAEAVVNFTNNFVNPRTVAKKRVEFPYRSVTTKKTEQVYIQVEDCEFLIGVSLLKQHCEELQFYAYSSAIRTVLSNAYKTFRLFFGNFTRLKNNDEDKFKDRLEYFFSRYIPLLKLHKIQLLDLLEGAAFLPVPGPLYLNVVTLAAEVREEFPSVEKVLIMYQDKLLYYTVSTKDLPTLFRYLTQNLLKHSMGEELEPQRSTVHGKYLRGPCDLSNDDPLEGDDAVPTVFLHEDSPDDLDENMKNYYMLTYRSLNATMCMFVKGDVSRKLLRNIDAFVGSELSTLASQIGEAINEQNDRTSAKDFHFIYFNPSSLSLTSSFDSTSIGTRPPFPPVEINRLVCETMKNFMSDDEDFEESFVKADCEWWIILKKVNSRFLCLLIPPSSSQQSLADIQTKTQTIIKTHFEAIFFS